MENLDLEKLFGDIYKNKTVFITGHTGFKGAWLAYWLKLLGANVVGFALKPNTKPAHFNLLTNEYHSIIGDIKNSKQLTETLSQYAPDIVFHLAAQPLVRDSYKNPVLTYKTNVMGTLHLYEAVRNTPSVKALVCITTDKVYYNKEQHQGYSETDNLGGHDPYSASKACVEILSDSYRKSFFQDKILLATARAGNVMGGGDWAKDRLISDVVKATANNKSVSIRNPHAIRPWQHVLDPLSAYLLLGQKLLENNRDFAEAWNIAPHLSDCRTVKEVLDLVKKQWDKVDITYAPDAENLHEAGILKLNTTKANEILHWQPVWNLEKAVEKTIEWYKVFYETGEILTQKHIETFVQDAQCANSVWTQ